LIIPIAADFPDMEVITVILICLILYATTAKVGALGTGYHHQAELHWTRAFVFLYALGFAVRSRTLRDTESGTDDVSELEAGKIKLQKPLIRPVWKQTRRIVIWRRGCRIIL